MSSSKNTKVKSQTEQTKNQCQLWKEYQVKSAKRTEILAIGLTTEY